MAVCMRLEYIHLETESEKMQGDWARLQFNMAAVFFALVFTAKQGAVKRKAVKICLGFLSKNFLLKRIKVLKNLKAMME